MKNKEAYKQAFKHVHYQKEVNLNKKRISKPLVTIMTSFIVLLSTFTVAYAFDVGGIQSKLEVWFRGEKRKVQYKEEDKNAYHFYTTDEDGNVVDMGINMGFKGSLTGIEPMSGDEPVSYTHLSLVIDKENLDQAIQLLKERFYIKEDK